jgi:hypothetical protein
MVPPPGAAPLPGEEGAGVEGGVGVGMGVGAGEVPGAPVVGGAGCVVEGAVPAGAGVCCSLFLQALSASASIGASSKAFVSVVLVDVISEPPLVSCMREWRGAMKRLASTIQATGVFPNGRLKMY